MQVLDFKILFFFIYQNGLKPFSDGLEFWIQKLSVDLNRKYQLLVESPT